MHSVKTLRRTASKWPKTVRIVVIPHMAGQLSYLILLAEENAAEQQRLGRDIAELHQAILSKEFAALCAALLTRSRYPDTAIKETLQAASSAGIFLSGQALTAAPELEPRTIVRTDMAVLGVDSCTRIGSVSAARRWEVSRRAGAPQRTNPTVHCTCEFLGRFSFA
jgi:hypothetical protein